MKKEKNTVILLAGGKGNRMGSKTPKQFLDILGKPVLYYSIKSFQESPLIDEIVLVASDDTAAYCRKEIVEKYQCTKVTQVTAGGKERYDSVYEGLKCCKDTGYIWIHDGARPFVTPDMLERGLEMVKRTGACAAGVPSKDTIKIADADGLILETPQRDNTWVIQTPQVFSCSLIKEAYERLSCCDKSGVTDDAMVVEKMTDHPVRIFMGDYRNIKITTPEDLETAEIFAKKMQKDIDIGK